MRAPLIFLTALALASALAPASAAALEPRLVVEEEGGRAVVSGFGRFLDRLSAARGIGIVEIIRLGGQRVHRT